jgi:hypothetical protein
MKKAILLILAAVLMVASGVAAVSAYEAHIINVTAKVENALDVQTTAIDFGTRFPEEWKKFHRDVSLSDSAIAELGTDADDLEYVEIQAFAEWKENETKTGYTWNGTAWESWPGYWDWMGYFLWVGFDPIQDDPATPEIEKTVGMSLVGPPVDPPPSAQPILASTNLTDATVTQLAVAIDTPVFEGYYNPLTDPEPKPSGLDDPSWIIPDGSGKYSPIPVAHPAYDATGMYFGIDLKIQVTDIGRAP